jgi:hypothetical protein
MAIEGGQKVRFGPLRIRLARRACISGLILAFGAFRCFDAHSQFLAWPFLILAIVCGLFAESSLLRYVQFTNDGYITHNYRLGLVPSTREGAFKDIRSVSATSGPLPNTQYIVVLRNDGKHRMLTSASSTKTVGSTDETSARFQRLIDEIREAVERAVE